MNKASFLQSVLILNISFCYLEAAKRSIRRNVNCECGILSQTRFKREKFDPFNLKPSIGNIVGGYKTKVNEFPWMAGLHKIRCSRIDRLKDIPVCGGALISSQHVITAAHCVEGKSIYNLFLLKFFNYYFLDGLIECISLGDHDYRSFGETKSLKRSILESNRFCEYR